MPDTTNSDPEWPDYDPGGKPGSGDNFRWAFTGGRVFHKEDDGTLKEIDPTSLPPVLENEGE